jgi:hypothetical protein
MAIAYHRINSAIHGMARAKIQTLQPLHRVEQNSWKRPLARLGGADVTRDLAYYVIVFSRQAPLRQALRVNASLQWLHIIEIPRLIRNDIGRFV